MYPSNDKDVSSWDSHNFGLHVLDLRDQSINVRMYIRNKIILAMLMSAYSNEAVT